MKQRVGGKARTPVPALPGSHPGRPVDSSVILGIDPSLPGTGFGVIRQENRDWRSISHGSIHCPAGWERSRCLVQIATELRDLVKKTKPTVCVVESLFYAQNLQTALIMGEARGAAM